MKTRDVSFVLLSVLLMIFLFGLTSAATMQNMGNKTFVSGQSMEFGNDYVLLVNSIDPASNRANIILTMGAQNVFNKWFSQGDDIVKEGVINAEVYSIYSSASSGNAVLSLNNIMILGPSSSDGNNPTTGNPVCTESWTCKNWTACFDGSAHRKCVDSNNCGTITNKPSTTRTCIFVPGLSNQPSQCIENWKCTGWSACINNLFTRTCTELNNCGTSVNKPQDSLACNLNTPQNPNEEVDESDPAQSNPEGNLNTPSSSSSNSSKTIIQNFYTNYISNYNGLNQNNSPYTVNVTESVSGIGPMSLPPFSPGWPLIILGIILLLLLLILYIYISSTFSSIADRTENYPSGIAWIPLIGPMLISSRAARMHWWPILLFVIFPLNILMYFPELLPLPITLIAPISILSIFVFFILFVFSAIWMWKTFKAVGRPGGWILFNIIPVLGNIVFLILLGVAAWGKPKTKNRTTTKVR